MKMMKKIFLGLIVICLCLTVVPVKAISQDLIDEHDNIGFPYIIYNTGSEITVYDTEDYDLYAQWIEISMDKYNEINDKMSKYNDLVDDYNDYISDNVPNSSDYNSMDEYKAAETEYKQEVQRRLEELDTTLNEYYEAVPNFDDTKWEKLTDDTVYLPEADFTGTKPHILYVKLDDKQNSIVDYEFRILEIDGQEETGVEIPTIPEVDDINWVELKTGLKTNENILEFNNDDYSVSFDETNEDAFEIVVSSKDGNKSYKFVLNYSDGIVNYKVQGNEPEGFEMLNEFIIPNVIYEFCELYNYNYEAFIKWLAENEGKLTLTGNGITYELKEYSYEEKTGVVDVSVSGSYFESLSINIAYPITGFTNPGAGGAVEDGKDEDNEESPGTGDLDIIMIGAAMAIFAGVATVAYRKKNA